MDGKFRNKVVLITGGAMGLGQAIALAFAREKASIVISDIMVDKGEETARQIREAGGEALFIKTDISRREDIEAMVQKTAVEYGRIDCAINNAGVGQSLALTADLAEDEWDRIIGIDLRSVWLCCKYEIPHMLKQGGGVIVNMSSASGTHGTPYQCAYSAAKHGVLGLTKTVALEYAKSGIRANAICPGPIRTAGLEDYFIRDPQAEAKLSAGMPMGRVGMPAEIAETALWLCSDGASFITGQSILVDGGKSVA
ncbi:MAG: glucose 1-dehydrogenase [Rhodocyclaceae bacterium]|jgi:NAD(P)-dependent dehydrogenase (short-subunit alcohol dehydrogenase family)|nr:glucose 1-dehydrogenase [Rhodocyclaceae bacterium]